MSVETTPSLPEPPDHALVGLFDPSGEDAVAVFERDDDGGYDARWYDAANNPHTWPRVLERAVAAKRRVVRLYREDDPAIRDLRDTVDGAVAAAKRLLLMERRNAGSGRDGHLHEMDLLVLFQALGVEPEAGQ